MISIIIPVYNVAPYLEECVMSIIQQDMTDWECILVDDGSTDGSGEICNELAKLDNRISVIHQENKGVSAARNMGIEAAKGKYCTFIDSDDWVEKDYLTQLMDETTNGKISLVASGLTHEYDNRKKQKFSFPNRDVIKFDSEHIKSFIDHIGLLYGPMAKIYELSIILENGILYPNDYSLGEDLIFNFEYLNHIDHIVGIPYNGYHYRHHDGDTLTKKFRQDLFDIKIFQWRKQKSFLESKGMWDDYAKKHFYHQLWGIIYDGLFLYPKLTGNSKSYIKEILSIPEISDLKSYQESFKCSSWLKWIILHRQGYALKLYFNLPYRHTQQTTRRSTI